MLSSINKEQGKKYTFVSNGNWVNNTVLGEKTFCNDIYTKHNAKITDLTGELIVCSDITKIDGFCKKIVPETYEEYLELISKRDFKKEQWVYNLLDGTAEQDKVLYRDDLIVIAPNYTWDTTDLSKMYLLTFPTTQSIRSIRDLTDKHIGLLEHIKLKTLETIKSTYGFDSDIIKMFLHYAPSTYHLHIHFTLISNIEVCSSIEYSHELNNLIEILKIKPNFYQTNVMNKRI